jgi:hypothetical protein
VENYGRSCELKMLLQRPRVEWRLEYQLEDCPWGGKPDRSFLFEEFLDRFR